MTSDYPGDPHQASSGGDVLGDLRADGFDPHDFGQAVPGLEQLLGTLISGPTASELAGEQAALAMFRANVRPPASGRLPASGRQPATSPAATRPMRQRRVPALSRFRLAAAAAVAVVGGFAAAAYAAVLPAPVQHIAYQAFHFMGVPDAPRSGGAGSGGSPSSIPPSSHPHSPVSGRSHPTPSASAAPGGSASTSPSASPKPHPSSSATGSGANTPGLTVQAAASQIPAGTAVTVAGRLTAGGKPLAGITVSLIERPAGQRGWQAAGRGSTDKQGDVTITVPSLVTNASFRLIGPDGATSAAVRITVVPYVTAAIQLGSSGVKDYLTVSTLYAHRGDVVLLQVERNGVWVNRQTGLLNRAGTVVFVLSAQRMQGQVLRVVLLATARHARAVRGPITVPPPA
jgi:hypothetical protein